MENQILFQQIFNNEVKSKEKNNINEEIDNDDLVQKKKDKNYPNQCYAAPVSYLLNYLSQAQNQFILVGDIILDFHQKIEEDIDQLLRQAFLLQDKKYVNSIAYFKNQNIIQVSHNNKIKGCSDFQQIIYMLMQSQNQNNKILAEELQNYWYHIFTIELQYKSLIQNRGLEYLIMEQKFFYKQNIERFCCQSNKEDCHAYFCISLLEQNELGIPLNIQYGISDSLCAILGCGPAEMIEILSKTIHINLFLGREYMPYTNLQIVDHIRFNQQFQLMSDVYQWVSEGKLYTLDGIYLNFTVKSTQIQQVVDGLKISSFVQTEFSLDSTQIQNIIQIRQNKSNQFNQRNILDLLITDNIPNQFGLNFFNHISDKNNFKPPSPQDKYPEKTCKYKQI